MGARIRVGATSAASRSGRIPSEASRLANMASESSVELIALAVATSPETPTASVQPTTAASVVRPVVSSMNATDPPCESVIPFSFTHE